MQPLCICYSTTSTRLVWAIYRRYSQGVGLLPLELPRQPTSAHKRRLGEPVLLLLLLLFHYKPFHLLLLWPLAYVTSCTAKLPCPYRFVLQYEMMRSPCTAERKCHLWSPEHYELLLNVLVHFVVEFGRLSLSMMTLKIHT